MSIISILINKSELRNRAVCFKNHDLKSILDNIEIGSGERYHSSNKNGNKSIEVWIHLRRPINSDECSEFRCIIDNSDIPEEEVFYNGMYDYHLNFFPVAWLEDIWPKLVSTTV